MSRYGPDGDARRMLEMIAPGGVTSGEITRWYKEARADLPARKAAKRASFILRSLLADRLVVFDRGYRLSDRGLATLAELRRGQVVEAGEVRGAAPTVRIFARAA